MSDDSAAKHRAKQTLRNLVLSLLACLGLVAVIVLAVPRDESVRIKHVDYLAVAADVQAANPELTLVTPNLPEGWWCNKATWNGKSTDGIKTWNLGLIGPDNQYVGYTQAFDVNPTWFVGQLGDGAAASAPISAGESWFLWNANPQHDPMKTRDHVWALGINAIEKAQGTAFLLFGAESKTDFETIRAALEVPVQQQGGNN